MSAGTKNGVCTLDVSLDRTGSGVDNSMPSDRQTYHLKVDSSGRIVLPAAARARNHIAEGDTLVVVEDDNGLHVRTRDQIIAEAQSYFAFKMKTFHS